MSFLLLFIIKLKIIFNLLFFITFCNNKLDAIKKDDSEKIKKLLNKSLEIINNNLLNQKLKKELKE